MMHRSNFSIILLAFISLNLLNAGLVNTVNAAQNNIKDVHQSDPGKISGKVTEVINMAGYTYAEVDTGKEKVWAAGPVTPLKTGDMVAFSSQMPMKNFHSKTIERDFSIIYFIKNYITDKETSTIASSHDQAKQQQIVKPSTTTAAAVGTPGEVKVGDYLREATLDGLNVGTKKFSDFKGKPLIINVWASWCGPWRAEMGSLERLAQQYNGKEFNVIGISTDDYRNKATDFIKQTGITFDNFLDSKLLLENMLGANTIPLTILVDADGRVLGKLRGAYEWDSQAAMNAIGAGFQIKLMQKLESDRLS